MVIAMANGCKYTLRDYDASEHCNHIMGVDLEIWFMVCSFLVVLLILFGRMLYGLFTGEKLGDMVDKLVDVDEDDDDKLNIQSIGGIISTLSGKDDDDDDD